MVQANISQIPHKKHESKEKKIDFFKIEKIWYVNITVKGMNRQTIELEQIFVVQRSKKKDLCLDYTKNAYN